MFQREKYHFNPHALRYEKVERTWWQYLLRIFGFLCATAVSAFIIILIAYAYFDSPKEKQLKSEIRALKLQYKLLNKDMEQMAEVLRNLEQRDDNIYRVVFEAEAIPEAVRKAGYGGSKQYKELEMYDNAILLINTKQRVDKLKRKLYVQSKSYDEIAKMINNKKDMLAATPAIQPIYNKDLTRIASGFGYRIDPIYKTRKMHSGIDFTAPRGTEIYATGKGSVEKTSRSRTYGKYVIVDHGYGYKTLYAHMSQITVYPGQKVNRGEVIGLVGSTGKSTAPHLHYEVHKQGNRINPINFFYNDLTPDQYEKLIQVASQYNQSFD